MVSFIGGRLGATWGLSSLFRAKRSHSSYKSYYFNSVERDTTQSQRQQNKGEERRQILFSVFVI